MRRRLFIIILVPAILLIAGYFYLRTTLQKANKKTAAEIGQIETTDSLGGKKLSKADLRPLFINRMQQLLKKSSNGLYDLVIGDMEVDVLASTISLRDVTVKPNKTVLDKLTDQGEIPQNIMDVSFQSLVIDGINLDDAITRKTMDYRSVKLIKPVIHIYRKQSKNKKEDNAEDFSQRFLKEMTKLDVKRLTIEGGTIISHNAASKTAKLDDVDVYMNDILLDSTTRSDTQRFLFAKEATINFKNYTTQTSDGLYQFKIGNGSIAAHQRQAVLQNISFASPLSQQEFVKRQKNAKELFDLSLSSISLQGVDWWNLFNGEELTANELTARNGQVSIYLDRTLPPASRMGNFPNQLLAKLPLKMNVSRMNVQNLDLAYTEYNPLSKQKGTVYLDNISLKGSNLSTTDTKPLVISGSALFMHQVPVNATFTFDMQNPKAGGFTASVTVNKNFEGNIINPFTVPLGMMKIEKGSLQKLQATLKGNQTKASGNVLLLYKDLKIHVMEKDAGKKALDKKDVTTFLANLFVIKNDNPKEGKEPRRETASFQRDPNGGFFMLVWKTILVGALKTIGAPEKMAYKKPTG